MSTATMILVKPGQTVQYKAASGRLLDAVVVRNVYGTLTLKRNGVLITRNHSEIH